MRAVKSDLVGYLKAERYCSTHPIMSIAVSLLHLLSPSPLNVPLMDHDLSEDDGVLHQ